MSVLECNCAVMAIQTPGFKNRVHADPCPFAAIDRLVTDAILPLCELVRPLLKDADEDKLLDIMDCLVGWSSPEPKMGDTN